MERLVFLVLCASSDRYKLKLPQSTCGYCVKSISGLIYVTCLTHLKGLSDPPIYLLCAMIWGRPYIYGHNKKFIALMHICDAFRRVWFCSAQPESSHSSKKDNSSAKPPLLMQLFDVEFGLPTKRPLCKGAGEVGPGTIAVRPVFVEYLGCYSDCIWPRGALEGAAGLLSFIDGLRVV